MSISKSPSGISYSGGGVQIGTTSGTAADAALTNTAIAATATAARFRQRIPGHPLLWSRALNEGISNLVSGVPDGGGTMRQWFQVPSNTNMHDCYLEFDNYSVTGTGNTETQSPNPYTVSSCTVEYGTNQFWPVSLDGAPSWTVQPNGRVTNTDPIGLTFTESALVYVRTCVRIALAPTLAAAVVNSTGGTFAAGTVYYKVSAVCGPQGESGPSAEISATVAANGSITLNWTGDLLSVAATGYNIYRSATTGTESYLTTVPGFTTTWTDTNALQPFAATGSQSGFVVTFSGVSGQIGSVGQRLVSGTAMAPGTYIVSLGSYNSGNSTCTVTVNVSQTVAANTAITGPVPAAPQRYPVGMWPNANGCGVNYRGFYAGTGTDETYTPGNTWINGTNAWGCGPTAMVGQRDDGVRGPVVLIYGSSLASGQADTPGDQGYLVRAMQTNAWSYRFIPRAGSAMVTDAGNFPRRIIQANAATGVIIEQGSNDIGTAYTPTQIQTAELAIGYDFAKRGGDQWLPVVITTIGPRVNSLNGLVDTTNQFRWPSTIVAASNASPIVITTNQSHGQVNVIPAGPVKVGGVAGNTAANGNWYEKYLTATTFALYQDAACTNPVAGNGAYVAAGTVTGYQSGTTLTLTTGTLSIGQWVSYGTTQGSYVVSGTGPYTMSTSQTIGSSGSPVNFTTSGGLCDNQPWETNRITEDTWRRGLMPCTVSGNVFTPVPVGTTGAGILTAGMAGHPFVGYVESGATLECNAAGTLTMNGGYWLPNATPYYYTPDGIHWQPVACATVAAAVATPLQAFFPNS